MENSEIAQTWAEYYPHYRDSRSASQICRLICELVRARAKFDIGSGNAEAKLLRAVAAAGIKIEEFNECAGPS